MPLLEASVAPVSVVIPCYRCAETIERAVGSVAAQTLLPAEVILVEDFGQDETGSILRQLEANYSNDWIKVIELAENSGPSIARNRGWDAAQGKYVAFLDADDSWHPRKLEMQSAVMDRDPLLTLVGTGWGNDVMDLGGTPEPVSISAKSLLLQNRFCTSGVMVRRDLPLRFQEGKNRSEDYLLWLSIALGGGRLALLDAPLAIYYKASFGESGLSRDVWKMQAGQLDTYRQLRQERLIGTFRLLALQGWSNIKFVRRLAIVYLRRLFQI